MARFAGLLAHFAASRCNSRQGKRGSVTVNQVVTNALNATVTVRQLSADELRKRGISLNPDNYDVDE
jgi:hypothetical protein